MVSAAQSFEASDRNELPLPLAFLASCLICSLIFLAVYLWMAPPRPLPPKPVPVRVVLVQLPTPPPPPPPVAPPPDALPPPPPPVVIPVAPQATIVVPPTPPAPPAPPRKEAPRRHAIHREPVRLLRPVERPPTPIEMAPAAIAIVAPPAPRPAASDRAARDTLEGRIKQAIQRTQHYPESAKMMGVHGTAIVGFDYRDRSASDVRIIRSSSSLILDAEAIRDVRDAVFPPPGEMSGRTLSLQVTVVFDLVSDED
jgi:TonB family protein